MRRSQDDFNAEVQAHLELEVERLINEEGLSEAEARWQARRNFGNVTGTRERFYESRRWIIAGNLMQDVRYALRMLGKNRLLAAAAIGTIAVGIGTFAAIFTVVDGVLLRPLPYPDPDRLLMCVQRHADFGPETVTLPDYLDWRDHSTRFENLAGAWNQNFNLTGVDEPERVPGAAVTANLFATMGVAPVAGRVFNSDADRSVVVLGQALWQRQFGQRSDVIGKPVQLNGRPYTVVGVMPASFTFPTPAELWVPLVVEPGLNRGYHNLWVVGRLRPGSSIDEVRAELGTLAARAEREYPQTNRRWGVQVAPLQEHVIGSTRRPLLILSGAVACLLLLACANVAGLLLSRSVTRRHEIATRSALGASRWRITRLLLIESVVLSICGAVVGLVVTVWSMKPILSLAALPRADEVAVDGRVLLVTLIAALAAGVLFGLAPALTAWRFSRRDELNVRGGTRRVGLRPVLVGVQFAAAVVLLSGAGLLMRSFHRLQQVDTGLDAERVLAGRFFLPRVMYPAERAVRLYGEMIERVSRLPGVESAAAVSAFPFSGVDANVVFEIPGRAPEADVITANFRAATPGYFRTMGIRLMEGRDFAGSDSANSAFVAVVNRAFVDRFFPGRSPIGEAIKILGPKPRTIVGVVSNVRHRRLDSAPEPEIYVSHAQFPTGGMFLAVRMRNADAMAAASNIRSELKALDPVLPLPRFESWPAMVGETLATRRFSLVLMTIFAAAGLLLAAVGTYGMLAFNVSQRVKEFGIRMAMGAAPRDIVRDALSGSIAPAAIGLAGGFVLTLASSRLLKGLLFETAPTEPVTLGMMLLLLSGAAVAASVLPVRRALRVDPATALRQE